MNASGQVLASHFKKFRQINRFAELILDTIREIQPTNRLRIVDFGCGKSYLTFATHYLLRQIMQVDCEIVGLDLRQDVISGCNRITEKLELTGLRFQVGSIENFESNESVDLVISLHACNLATDSAILKAIQWGSKAILAVPCCQYELNEMLEKGAVPVLTSHGILKDRIAALATDGMRAKLLESVGYQTQVLEFIETEHTPKNLMIRALLSANNSEVLEQRKRKAIAEVESLRRSWGVPPLALEKQLRELGYLDSN